MKGHFLPYRSDAIPNKMDPMASKICGQHMAVWTGNNKTHI